MLPCDVFSITISENNVANKTFALPSFSPGAATGGSAFHVSRAIAHRLF